jgi:hypothetical protein
MDTSMLGVIVKACMDLLPFVALHSLVSVVHAGHHVSANPWRPGGRQARQSRTGSERSEEA